MSLLENDTDLFKTAAEPRRREHYPRYKCSEQVYVCKWCHEGAEDLLAYGTDTQLIILQRVKTKQSKSNWSFTVLKAYSLGSRVTAIAWSPHTRFTVKSDGATECTIGLAVASANWKLYLIDNDTVDALSGVTDQVNDVAFSNHSSLNEGALVASVSEDRTLRLHATTHPPTLLHVQTLSHPARTVSFHPFHPNLLLIAETSGAIRLWDVSRALDSNSLLAQSPSSPWVLTLLEPLTAIGGVGGQGGLKSADWKWLDKGVVGAIVGQRWIWWDVGESTDRLKIGSAEGSGEIGGQGGKFRWCPTNPKVFAVTTNSPPKSSDGPAGFRFYNTAYPQTPQIPPHPSHSTARTNDLSWHSKEQACVAAVGRTLYFYEVEV